MADLGVVRALAKVGDVRDRYCLQAPGGLDTYICFQPARGAGAAAAEQPIGQQLAMLRLRPVQEAVQAVLPKAGLALRREWLAGRTGSRAILRHDALDSRIA